MFRIYFQDIQYTRNSLYVYVIDMPVHEIQVQWILD